MSLAGFTSDTATFNHYRRELLNQHGTDVVNNTAAAMWSDSSSYCDINNVTPTPAQGIVTEIIAVPGIPTRQI